MCRFPNNMHKLCVKFLGSYWAVSVLRFKSSVDIVRVIYRFTVLLTLGPFPTPLGDQSFCLQIAFHSLFDYAAGFT